MGHGKSTTRFTALAAVVVTLALLSTGCAFVARASESQTAKTTAPAAADGGSFSPSLSSTGQFVAFESLAPDVVVGDTNGVGDVFVRDRSGGTAAIVSVSDAEAPATGPSYSASISADGRYVAFISNAANLVAGDTNGAADVFVRDRTAGTTSRVSIATNGAQAAGISDVTAISADGRYVTFESNADNLVAGDANGTYDVFVRDRNTNTTTRVSVATNGVGGDDTSSAPKISNDGRYVTFQSDADNLVAGDTNGTSDVFVRDRTANTTTRVSVATNGAQSDSKKSIQSDISGDGRYVAFTSLATNLVVGDTNARSDVFVRDRTANTTTRVSVAGASTQVSGDSGNPSISDNGRYVSFGSTATTLVGGDTNGHDDVFLRDRTANTTARPSVSTAGVQGNADSESPSMSGDGKIVGFESAASNFAAADPNGDFDVFVRDIAASTLDLVSRYRTVQGNLDSANPDLSADGRLVAFESSASNLVPGDTNGTIDVFVRDLVSGTTERVSVSTAGVQGNGVSVQPSISGSGRFVAFESEANNLVSGDTNGAKDVFMYDRTTHTTERISVASDGVSPANHLSRNPDVSFEGRFVSFDSFATNLIPGVGMSPFSTIYVRDRTTDTTVQTVYDATAGAPNSGSDQGALSGSGRYVVFSSSASDLVSGDTDGVDDIYRFDRDTGTNTRVSFGSSGAQPNSGCESPSVSDDGRYVVFRSSATNLVAGDTNNQQDIFVRDLVAGVTTRVSVDSAGVQGNADSGFLQKPSISDDGRFVSFISSASNLVPNDTNGAPDSFVRDLPLNRTTRVSSSQQLAQSNSGSAEPVLSSDGRYVAYYTSATSDVAPDTNGDADVIVRANPVPTITSATPTTVARGATATITVNGTYFLPGVAGAFGDGITITATNRVSESQVKFTISVAPTAATGSRAAIVFLVGTGPGVLTGAAAQFTLNVT